MVIFRSRDGAYLALIALLWIAAIVLVNPIGEYAISDDWAYRQSVEALVERGEIFLSPWNAANLVSHIAWGAIFAAIFGASNTVLRISSLVAALICGVALYRLMRLNGNTPGVALLATIVALFNPLSFILAFSFMSDVSYAAMQTVALWLIAAGTLQSSPWKRSAGWVAGVAALLSRQTGLAVAIGGGVERGLRGRFTWRSVVLAALPIVLFLAVQIGFQHWLSATGRLSPLYGTQVARTRDALLHHPVFLVGKAAEVLVYTFFYVGLFALPLTLALVPLWTDRWSPGRRRTAMAAAAVASVAIAAAVTLAWRPFPMWANTLMTASYGPDLDAAPSPPWLSFAVTVLAAGGGLLLCLGLVHVALALRDRWHERSFDATRLVLLSGAAYLAAVMLVPDGFDRYLIAFVPCALAVLAASARGYVPGGAALRIGGVVMAALAAVSICGTHDLLAAKREQAIAYRALVRTVPWTRIDAGWVMVGAKGFARYPGRDICCWYDRADYIVSTGEEPKAGFRVIGRRPVRRWLPWQWGRYPVLIQQRTS